jgi:Cu/Ag efflux pump CusA
MRPIAAPVVGGMLSSLVHILFVTPVLFALIHGRRNIFMLSRSAGGTPSEAL